MDQILTREGTRLRTPDCDVRKLPRDSVEACIVSFMQCLIFFVNCVISVGGVTKNYAVVDGQMSITVPFIKVLGSIHSPVSIKTHRHFNYKLVGSGHSPTLPRKSGA